MTKFDSRLTPQRLRQVPEGTLLCAAWRLSKRSALSNANGRLVGFTDSAWMTLRTSNGAKVLVPLGSCTGCTDEGVWLADPPWGNSLPGKLTPEQGEQLKPGDEVIVFHRKLPTDPKPQRLAGRIDEAPSWGSDGLCVRVKLDGDSQVLVGVFSAHTPPDEGIRLRTLRDKLEQLVVDAATKPLRGSSRALAHPTCRRAAAATYAAALESGESYSEAAKRAEGAAIAAVAEAASSMSDDELLAAVVSI